VSGDAGAWSALPLRAAAVAAPAAPAAARHRAWRSDPSPAIAPALLLCTLLVLMVVPEGLDYAALAQAGSPAAGSAVSRALWLGLFAGALLLIAWRAPLALALLRRLNPLLLPMVALAVASVAWSIDPGLSARRVFRLVTILAVALAFVLYGWHARRAQAVLRPALTLLLLGSLAFGLAFPGLAIHTETAPELAGAWHGLANHKNGLGALAGIGLVFWVHAALARQARALPVLVGLAAAGACLLLSRSTTAAVAAAFGVGWLLFALGAPRALRWALPALAVVLAVVLALATFGLLGLVPGAGTLIDTVTAVTDKDGSLTGRTGIWAIVFEHVDLRPWLGSGYAAYWTGQPAPGNDSYAFIERMNGFYPGSAHNGALEVLNDLGGIGLAGLFAYLALHLRQALQLQRIEPAQAALWLGLFFQLAVGNLSETRWFAVLSVDLVFMTVASAALARALLQHRFVARHGAAPLATRASDG